MTVVYNNYFSKTKQLNCKSNGKNVGDMKNYV